MGDYPLMMPSKYENPNKGSIDSYILDYHTRIPIPFANGNNGFLGSRLYLLAIPIETSHWSILNSGPAFSYQLYLLLPLLIYEDLKDSLWLLILFLRTAIRGNGPQGYIPPRPEYQRWSNSFASFFRRPLRYAPSHGALKRLCIHVVPKTCIPIRLPESVVDLSPPNDYIFLAGVVPEDVYGHYFCKMPSFSHVFPLMSISLYRLLFETRLSSSDFRLVRRCQTCSLCRHPHMYPLDVAFWVALYGSVLVMLPCWTHDTSQYDAEARLHQVGLIAWHYDLGDCHFPDFSTSWHA